MSSSASAIRRLLPDLRERSREPEELDAELPEAEVCRSLADLRRVNRWLVRRRSLLRAVAAQLPRGGRLLDVGSGSGDMPQYLRAHLPGPPLAVALDVKPLHLGGAPRGLARVAADVWRLPFAERSFDVVTAQHFLHHFDEAELARLLGELRRVARRAIVVNDLRRAQVPLAFARAVFPLVFQSPVSVRDGVVSIRRGFREHELRAAFATAGLTRVAVRRLFPYRLLAVAEIP